MNSFQKKVFTTLFLVFLSLLGLVLPHRPVKLPPLTQTAVLGEIAPNSGLSELHIQPEAGNKFLVDKINNASQSIHLSMYLLSDPEIIDSLISAHNRGIEVKIILEKAPFGGGNVNKISREKLVSAGVEVRDPPALIALNHQKSIIIDQSELIIMTLNLTKAAFTKNREYSVSDTFPPEVSEAEKIFEADWNRLPYFPTPTNLVISPETSRGKLESLIGSATKEVLVEDEVIQDPAMISTLADSSKKANVQVLLSNPKNVAQNLTAAADLRKGGVQVRFLLSPYLHAKLIITDQKYAYLGSINLTSQSLDQNRELGIIFTNPELLSPLLRQFANDWEMGTE